MSRWAMKVGMTRSHIKEMLFAYPTHDLDMAYMVQTDPRLPMPYPTGAERST